jgi:hypothetical protein
MSNRLYLISSLMILATILTPLDTKAETRQPWRIDQALATPAWLSLTGTHRLRFESLDSQFRRLEPGSDQMLVIRTTALLEIHADHFTVAGELMDSRAYLHDDDNLITTGIVNAVEPLQVYLQRRDADLILAGSKSNLRVGRITIDVGSRRFVARNRYRNTINSFTGIDWFWQDSNNQKLQVFFGLPVNRKPFTRDKLFDNHVELDEEDSEVKFWGLYYACRLSWGDQGEIYYFGIDEEDSPGRPTRDRQLSTVGFRIVRNPLAAHFDYQLESAVQFGESRSTILTNFTDLDHSAYFIHGELGYSWDHPRNMRLLVQYDYATGDEDPLDGNNERFDTLYGARRFDFGPTGIYGPFARANISSIGLRLLFSPRADMTSFVAYRGYWLASDKDAWVTTVVRDRSGETDNFLGSQIEVRFRWEIRPGNLRLETGLAYLFRGDFMKDAPNTTSQGDSTYFYSQVSFRF